MDRKSLEVLEYQKIQEMLAKETNTPLGRDLAMRAYPTTPFEARKRQKLGKEIAQALLKMPSPGIFGVVDVRSKVLRATQGFTLTGPDLKEISDVVYTFDSVRRWLDQLDANTYPGLMRIKGRLPKLFSLKKKLDETVGAGGEIKDSASPKLSFLRRSYREHQERLRKQAEDLTKRGDFAKYLQEPIVTIRNGRYVVPVKQEHASKIQGIVHDQSASGQTLFVEPAELVQMGNQLKRIELLERDEVERILSEVSALVADSSSSILEGTGALGEFDFGLAKARVLFEWKGSFPKIVDDHVISLVQAWHPLLKDNPVPMDLYLDEQGTRTVVITGPNMGGKTVALKTCGLLTAMALAGFPCPCHENTVIGGIEDILCDIGDEQSIEENLSTFSAHISNVKRVIKNAGPGKLVLIDELGAGTDPKEGAALGVAILSRIHKSKALCLVTSHYSEMKLFAQQTVGVKNASMEWDAVNMVPTYRLVVGRPGRSNAFLVAERLGLDKDILAEARRNMQEELVRLEDIIHEMEVSSQKARKEAENAANERRLYEKLREEYERKLLSLHRERKDVIRKAKQEAQSIIARARVEFEKALRTIKENEKKRRHSKEFSESVYRIRERLKKAREALSTDLQDEDPGKPLRKEDAVPGKTVRVLGFNEEGIIVESPGSDNQVLVQIGSIRLRTGLSNLRDLRKRGNQENSSSEKASQVFLEKAKTVPCEIDLRGMTKDEAFVALDKYLDDAFLAALPQVRIIHGKGTGMLRKAVQEFLSSQKEYVAGYRLGESSEGGAGVTIANLKV